MSTVVKMQHPEDPATKILADLGDLSKFEVFNDRVLLAVYERPAVTKGGIHLTDNQRKEDQFQGKAALIVKMGELVNQVAVGRGPFNIGDWVAVNPSEGWSMNIGEKTNKVMLRLLSEKSIHMRIPAPDSIW